jgi:predicted nuclease with TOPRIM domain
LKKNRIHLFNQFKKEHTKMMNQIHDFSDNIESLQNENNQLKQQLEDNQLLFETQKTEFISQIEKEKQEIEKIKIQLSGQFENDRREWNQLVQQFQSSSNPFESN